MAHASACRGELQFARLNPPLFPRSIIYSSPLSIRIQRLRLAHLGKEASVRRGPAAKPICCIHAERFIVGSNPYQEVVVLNRGAMNVGAGEA